MVVDRQGSAIAQASLPKEMRQKKRFRHPGRSDKEICIPVSPGSSAAL